MTWRRRDFIRTGIALAGTVATRGIYARPPTPATRAAVVIGVDKAGDLPKLSAAASGARMVADWLLSENFAVMAFIDDKGPVRVAEIFDAVDKLVSKGTLDQLVIYFSGHGFLIDGYHECWLLSGAPHNSNEAINLDTNCVLARESRIPNVVFISDACRSLPQSLNAGQVRGSAIFPSQAVSPNAQTEIDQFFATLLSNAALELPVAQSVKSFKGIYTSCLLDAFQHPEADMVQTVDGIAVVPNIKLKAYLRREVPRRAEAQSVKLDQTPDAILQGDPTNYIGRVVGKIEAAAASPRPVVPNLVDVANFELARKAGGSANLVATTFTEDELEKAAFDTGFIQAQSPVLDAHLPPQFGVRTGFAVFGTRLLSAVSGPGMEVRLITKGNGRTEPALVAVFPKNANHASSVGLRFADGAGTVVAGITDFVGAVVVENGKVLNVTYTPSTANSIWPLYKDEQQRLDQLHAVVATAARFGVFRIDGPRETRNQKARLFADQIRILKGVDPTLGLYAAYAYAEAGLPEQVRSVREFMYGDLQADLFDVAMLAGNLSGVRGPIANGPFPFCPMLSQGWGLLRIKDVILPPGVAKARDHLLNALWTTFDKDGMTIVTSVLENGKF